MKILHTSDWHIGHSLYTQKRTEEHARFLVWLTELVRDRQIDALIVAGDVFDNGAPGGGAQALYYDFLSAVKAAGCATVVITSGNHDSPRFLEAPEKLLQSFKIHVFGLPQSPESHVVELLDKDGQVGALCCAVPYLRKNEMVRLMAEGEDSDEKIISATRAFYRDVTDAALARREKIDRPIPIVATGHLFAAGAKTSEGDGVRELYVGSLGHVGADVFPSEFDYVALGHIHSAQTVAGNERIRYCGSPLPMSFSEIGLHKCVIEIDTDGMKIEQIAVPVFQQLARVSGGREELLGQLSNLKRSDVWIEAAYTGSSPWPSLLYDVGEAVAGGHAQVLRVRNDAMVREILGAEAAAQALSAMRVGDVFEKSLDENDVDPAQRAALTACFNEILAAVEESGE